VRLGQLVRLGLSVQQELRRTSLRLQWVRRRERQQAHRPLHSLQASLTAPSKGQKISTVSICLLIGRAYPQTLAFCVAMLR